MGVVTASFQFQGCQVRYCDLKNYPPGYCCYLNLMSPRHFNGNDLVMGEKSMAMPLGKLLLLSPLLYSSAKWG